MENKRCIPCNNFSFFVRPYQRNTAPRFQRGGARGGFGDRGRGRSRGGRGRGGYRYADYAVFPLVQSVVVIRI